MSDTTDSADAPSTADAASTSHAPAAHETDYADPGGGMPGSPVRGRPDGRNAELFVRAQRSIPGGVNSPVRAYRSVGGAPRFVRSARGATITDADGREYVDLVSSWGPALLGHAHPAVVEAVREAATRGLSFGAPTEGEVELAELVRGRIRI